jgi:hydrogenase maturation protease
VSRLLVVGVGNDLRGDDAAGLLAVRRLAALGPLGVDVLEHTGDPVALAEAMSGHDEVVVIDAVCAGDEPGAVLELGAEAGVLRGHASSHGLGLREALALAGLTGAPPAVRVIGIAGRRFDLGAPPSPAVIRAAAAVAARLLEARTCA